MQKSESEIIDIQLVATVLSVLSLLITGLLLYNQKLLAEKKTPIFSKKLTLQFVALNRIFVFIIVLIFLYANVLHFKLDKQNNEDVTFDYIDLFSSSLTIVIALLAIYTSFKALENNDLDIDLSVDEAI